MPIEWAIILAVAVSDAILLAETSFRLEASSQLRIAVVWILMAVVFVVCRWRRFPRLAHFAHTWLTLWATILSISSPALLLLL
jgi:hypothetical protein